MHHRETAEQEQGWVLLPENPQYTIFNSICDSVRFVSEKALTTYRGHLCATSSFVGVDGAVMGWHDFGYLEGPGWAANAVGGAWELLRYARFTRDRGIARIALSVLDHVLEDGFIDRETGLIWGYRHTRADSFCLNFKHNSDWLCPGSMACIGLQMLRASDLVSDRSRKKRLRHAAQQCAEWILGHVKMLPGGWLPRRVTPEGNPYPYRAEGGSDPIFEQSGDGLFFLWLLADLTLRGMGDYRAPARRLADAFIKARGFYGSINHDTYDLQENVAYSVAFRVLRETAKALSDPALKAFAYENALQGLSRFLMKEDRNGVATKGLLYMEDSWDTSYLWENAEAAIAYLEAYSESRRREYLERALAILRAAAKHHHGEWGFLTEGVDWNNHVGARHHFQGATYGDIQYTEPFLNHLHIVEPTLYYLERLARRKKQSDGSLGFYDHEGVLLYRRQD